jgi:ribosomal protein S18 acetylase RimI-like enzyme
MRVQTAHADAWEAHGRLRERSGGGVGAARGIRLMASGLPEPQWNNGDVSAADADVEAAREFYAGYGVPWGVRVPAGMPWAHGRHLFSKRLMGLPARDFAAAPPVAGLALRAAAPADLAAAAAIDAEAFGSDPAPDWIAPLLDSPRAVVVLAELGGEPVGMAYSLRSDGLAGPCLYVAGVGVVPAARRRGVGAAMSSWLLARGFAAGAELAHLHPDGDGAARIYARLGFTEVPGLEIYVDL